MMPVVYVAGPFRGPSAWAIECNIRAAETLALEVWKLGAAAICPHSNTRFYQGEADDRLWLDGDLAIIARCDALIMTPDWARSVGATHEHTFATERKIPIFYTLDQLYAWIVAREA